MSQREASIYREPRHYDALVGDYAGAVELAFYSRLGIRIGEPLLELGAGTGRLTIPLAEAGFRMTGLDIDASMLARAKEKAAERGTEVEWVEADARHFDLGRQYPVILLPNNAIAHFLDRQSVEAVFDQVRRHLAPGGRFVIDYFNPLLALLARDRDVRMLVGEYYTPDGKDLVRVTETGQYDAATQVNHLCWHYRLAGEDHEEVVNLPMRVYFPQELVDLLHYNGFEPEIRYGSFESAPFTSESFQHLLICRDYRRESPAPGQS